MLYNTLCNCIINIYFSYIYLLEVEKKVDNYGSMFQPRDKKEKIIMNYLMILTVFLAILSFIKFFFTFFFPQNSEI